MKKINFEKVAYFIGAIFTACVAVFTLSKAGMFYALANECGEPILYLGCLAFAILFLLFTACSVFALEESTFIFSKLLQWVESKCRDGE